MNYFGTVRTPNFLCKPVGKQISNYRDLTASVMQLKLSVLTVPIILKLPVFAPITLQDTLLNQACFDPLYLCTDLTAYLSALLGGLAFFFC